MNGQSNAVYYQSFNPSLTFRWEPALLTTYEHEAREWLTAQNHARASCLYRFPPVLLGCYNVKTDRINACTAIDMLGEDADNGFLCSTSRSDCGSGSAGKPD